MASTADRDGRLLRAGQCARRLSVTKKTFYRIARRHMVLVLGRRVIGSQSRWTAKSIDDYLERAR